MSANHSLQKLLDELGRLPGIGPKSAQRIAYYLLEADAEEARRLAEAILEVKQEVHFCSRCFNYATADECSICQDSMRDTTRICVVGDPRDVQAYVMGEHGDSEFVAWSSAQVAGVPLNTFCELHGHLEHEAAEKRIAEDVKNSAYTIIEKKHATYYGVAMAVKRICTAVMRDEQTVLPVSSLMVGEYGLSDLAISMPTVVGRDGVVCRVPVPLNDDEQHELTASAKALKDIIDSVDFSC